MALNFGENYENKKIELDDNNFRTFEGIQIKLNETSGSDDITGRTTLESKEGLLLSERENQSKSDQPLNTLKEPIIDTLKRDLFNISEKVKFVLLPKNGDNYKQLYNCKRNDLIFRGFMGTTIILSFTIIAIVFKHKGSKRLCICTSFCYFLVWRNNCYL